MKFDVEVKCKSNCSNTSTGDNPCDDCIYLCGHLDPRSGDTYYWTWDKWGGAILTDKYYQASENQPDLEDYFWNVFRAWFEFQLSIKKPEVKEQATFDVTEEIESGGEFFLPLE